MRTCEQILVAACAPHDPKMLYSGEGCAWARAADLIVGVITASPETWQARVDEAYANLENAPVVLRRDDLWSLVLLVQFPVGTPDTVKRYVERQTMGSRKLAFCEDEHVPSLFRGFVGPREAEGRAASVSASVVEKTLQSFAGSDDELWRALEVLLKPRQPREEVDELIRMLSREARDAH